MYAKHCEKLGIHYIAWAHIQCHLVSAIIKYMYIGWALLKKPRDAELAGERTEFVLPISIGTRYWRLHDYIVEAIVRAHASTNGATGSTPVVKLHWLTYTQAKQPDS